MWMPYYNAIAYPVDMFSSYYSGFATYTTFRQGDTISYYTPSFVEYYNHRRYHEALDNATPADIYHGRQRKVLDARERIKREALSRRRIYNLTAAA